MARLRDWINLGKSTLNSLNSSDVTNLYVVEWPETKKMLIAEHSEAIEREPRRFKRWIRTVSAIFYGLAMRLAPHRRILFLLSFLAFFVCLISITHHIKNPPWWVITEIVATFLVMTFLLAMELIDKLKYRDELQLARDLQASLIPKELASTDSYELAAFNRIANTVGGDIYDFVPLPDGRLAVLFGDASGHGMAAGLVMAVAHAAFRTQLEVDPSPPSIIATLNRILCRTGGSRSFFSCVYLLFEPDGTFLATIAGHPPILKIDTAGQITARIGRGAYPLGVKSGLTYETITETLALGERLLLHSDGLTESRDQHQREFGDDYLTSIASWQPSASAQALLDTVISEWRMFIGSMPPEDDVSVAVVVRR